MRHALLTGALLGLVATAQAQAWETAVQLTATGFNFRGPSAVRDSFINRGRTGNYTNNPYGALRGAGYGAALQQQRVTRRKALFGLQVGYERLRSRVKIFQTWPTSDGLQETARGRTYLIHEFGNVHPYVGRRLELGPVSLDATAGLDLGMLLQCREKGSAAISSGPPITTDLERTQPDLDARVRLNLTSYYRRVGLAASYSHGLTNYRRGWVGGVNEAYSQAWRLGVVYRLW